MKKIIALAALAAYAASVSAATPNNYYSRQHLPNLPVTSSTTAPAPTPTSAPTYAVCSNLTQSLTSSGKTGSYGGLNGGNVKSSQMAADACNAYISANNIKGPVVCTYYTPTNTAYLDKATTTQSAGGNQYATICK